MGTVHQRRPYRTDVRIRNEHSPGTARVLVLVLIVTLGKSETYKETIKVLVLVLVRVQ